MSEHRPEHLDPVAWTIVYLDGLMDEGVTIGADRQSDALPYVAIRADGGGSMNWLGTQARLGVTVWAESQQAAQNLALEVRQLILRSSMGDEVAQASCTLPMDATDSSRQPVRYMAATLRLFR